MIKHSEESGVTDLTQADAGAKQQEAEFNSSVRKVSHFRSEKTLTRLFRHLLLRFRSKKGKTEQLFLISLSVLFSHQQMCQLRKNFITAQLIIIFPCRLTATLLPPLPSPPSPPSKYSNVLSLPACKFCRLFRPPLLPRRIRDVIRGLRHRWRRCPTPRLLVMKRTKRSGRLHKNLTDHSNLQRKYQRSC